MNQKLLIYNLGYNNSVNITWHQSVHNYFIPIIYQPYSKSIILKHVFQGPSQRSVIDKVQFHKNVNRNQPKTKPEQKTLNQVYESDRIS